MSVQERVRRSCACSFRVASLLPSHRGSGPAPGGALSSRHHDHKRQDCDKREKDLSLCSCRVHESPSTRVFPGWDRTRNVVQVRPSVLRAIFPALPLKCKLTCCEVWVQRGYRCRSSYYLFPGRRQHTARAPARYVEGINATRNRLMAPDIPGHVVRPVRPWPGPL